MEFVDTLFKDIAPGEIAAILRMLPIFLKYKVDNSDIQPHR